jgi:membrane fusion protein (multidrug efflux system)
MQQALLVPQQAVTRSATGKPQAYVVGKDGKLQLRELSTERAIGDQWLVTSGLDAGDALVVSGQQKAQPGALVEALPYRQAPREPLASRATPAVAL